MKTRLYYKDPQSSELLYQDMEEVSCSFSDARQFQCYSGVVYVINEDDMWEMDDDNLVVRQPLEGYIKENLSQKGATLDERSEANLNGVLAVQVSQSVETKCVNLTGTLASNHVIVSRTATERVLGDNENVVPQLLDDGTMIIPVIEERLVVIKQRVLIEEVMIKSERRINEVDEPFKLITSQIQVSRPGKGPKTKS